MAKPVGVPNCGLETFTFLLLNDGSFEKKQLFDPIKAQPGVEVISETKIRTTVKNALPTIELNARSTHSILFWRRPIVVLSVGVLMMGSALLLASLVRGALLTIVVFAWALISVVPLWIGIRGVFGLGDGTSIIDAHDLYFSILKEQTENLSQKLKALPSTQEIELEVESGINFLKLHVAFNPEPRK